MTDNSLWPLLHSCKSSQSCSQPSDESVQSAGVTSSNAAAQYTTAKYAVFATENCHFASHIEGSQVP